MKPFTAAGLLLALICAATSWLAISSLDPPAALPTDTAADQFSAARAVQHLQVLAVSPRSVGSPGHAASLAYLQRKIRALGLKPQIQTSTSQQATPRKGWVTLVTIENLIARLRGKLNASPMLLSSHYDSVANSPGAGDDGFGVATMLEAMRALVEGPALSNDVIFLFTDAEEFGMLGAQAFMDEHPWAPKVKMLMNYDALGVRGPAIMFQTTEGNGPLIRQLRRVVDHPTAFSFTNEIYSRLPNETDFSILRRGGAAGYNFALVDGPMGYHTPLDNLDRIEANSIQHGGESAVDLVRQIDKTGVGGSWRGEDWVFFSLLGRWLIAYPKGLVLLLAVALVLGVGTLIALGFSRRHLVHWQLSAGRLAMAVISILLTVAAVGGFSFLAGRLLIPSRYYRFLIWGSRDSHAVTLLAIALMAAGLTLLISRWLVRLCGAANFAAAGMLLWACLTVIVSLRSPGASYLFALPLLFVELHAAAALPARVSEKPALGLGQFLLIEVAVAATALLWAPALAMAAMALHAGAALWVGGAVSVLLAGLLASTMRLATAGRVGLTLTIGLIVAGLALGFGARAASRHGDDNPSADTLIYIYNADSGQTNWVTFDPRIDSWIAQFVGETPNWVAFPKFFFHHNAVPSAPAPALAIREDGPQPSTVETLDQRISEERRVVDLLIDWRHEPARSIIVLESDGEIRSLTVNGQEVKRLDDATPEAGFKTLVRYYAPPSEGIEISAELVPASATLSLDVLGDWFELPQLEGFPSPQRPAAFIARNSVMADSTLVLNTFEIPVAEATRKE